MKTNKTPMQEFKCLFIEQFSPLAKSFESVTFSYEYLNILDLINESLEKEKQFAFDCFEAGIGCLVKNTHSVTFTDPIDFKKEFESFYAEQHKK